MINHYITWKAQIVIINTSGKKNKNSFPNQSIE